MNNWNDYKEYVKSVDPIAKEDISEAEKIASIVVICIKPI